MPSIRKDGLPHRPNTDAAISLPTLTTSLTLTASTKILQKPDLGGLEIWMQLSGTEGTKCRDKIRESAHIFRACATWGMEKNTADKSVVKQEVKTLRSRANVITWHVRSRFGSSLREVALAWPAEKA
jgi:hypothetical protein